MYNKFKADNEILLKTLNAVDTGVGIIAEDGNFIYVNEKYSDIYGYGYEELIGKNYLLIIPDEERENTVEFTRHLFENGSAKSQEWKRKRQDGTFLHVYATPQLITASDGSKYIVITVNDVTSIRDIELQLTKSERRYRSIIRTTAARNEEIRKLIMNAALDAIICIDRNDLVTLWNPQAEKIFGWSKEEVEGKKLADIIIPEMYREMHRRGMEKYLATGHGPALNVMLELKAINRQGHEFPIELTVLPIKQEHEEEIFCAFIRDITERKKNETMLKELNSQMSTNIEELAKSNIELEQFAFVASHDLQEPLRMVTNFLTQLDKRYHDQLDDKGKQYLNFAVDGAVRMRKIILDLLEYSRVGKLDINKDNVDLNDVLEEIRKLNRTAIEEKIVTITTDKLPVIQANKTAIQQVLQNLISNAIKYQDEGNSPKIDIKHKAFKNHWEFSVSDNGIGIDPKFHEKIFEIFQRLHNKEEYSGTGIGLAICKKIVESHGGTINVASEAGKGTTFYFTIKK